MFTLTLSCSSAPENIVPNSSVCPAISLSLSGDCWRHSFLGRRASLRRSSAFDNSTLVKSQIQRCFLRRHTRLKEPKRLWIIKVFKQSLFSKPVKVYRIGSSCIFVWGLWEQGGQLPRKNFDCPHSLKNKVFFDIVIVFSQPGARGCILVDNFMSFSCLKQKNEMRYCTNYRLWKEKGEI